MWLRLLLGLSLRKTLDVLFTGECGADMGGPTKEYFHVSSASLKKVDPAYNFQLFTGEEGHLVPVYGADVLSSGWFQMVGKLLAHSILHGGGGLVGLAPPITNYLVFGSIEEAGKLVTPQDLPDVDLQMLVEEKVNVIWTVLHAIKISPPPSPHYKVATLPGTCAKRRAITVRFSNYY